MYEVYFDPFFSRDFVFFKCISRSELIGVLNSSDAVLRPQSDDSLSGFYANANPHAALHSLMWTPLPLTRELSQPATFNFDPIYILFLSRVYRMYRCFQTLLKMGGSG